MNRFSLLRRRSQRPRVVGRRPPHQHGPVEALEPRTLLSALLLQDVAGTASADVTSVAVAGGEVFFSAKGGNQSGLYKTDGTAGGTTRLSSTWALAHPTDMVALGDTLYFSGEASAGGSPGPSYGLAKSDGTPAGTVMVKAFPHEARPTGITRVGSTLYFSAGPSQGDRELWKSDGTAAGTVRVKDIRAWGSSSPAGFTDINGTVYFVADDGTAGRELWKTDGTEAGTRLVVDLSPGAESSFRGPPAMLNFNGELLFITDGLSGTALWKTDGTATGTVRLLDIPAAPGVVSPKLLATVGGAAVFSAGDRSGLYRTDGTPSGTSPLRGGPGAKFTVGAVETALVGGALLFAAAEGGGGTELWKTDGTPGGTARVADLNPDTGSNPSSLKAIGGVAYFAADDGERGAELWKSDGTAAGTMFVKDINPGAAGAWHTSNSGFPSFHFVAGPDGQAYFPATDAFRGTELWVSDGTAAGTTAVKDFGVTASSRPSSFTAFRNSLFFTALPNAPYSYASNPQLYRSDGTPEGTFRVGAGMNTGPVLGDSMYYAVYGKPGFFRTDGTAERTAQILPAGSPNYAAEHLNAVDGALVFATNSNPAGLELWRSDGTSEGTRVIARIGESGGAGDTMRNISHTAAGRVMFFYSRTTSRDWEPWRTDGTAEGTFRLADIRPDGVGSGYGPDGTLSASVVSSVVVGNTWYFTADDGLGYALWKSDGSRAGTVKLPTPAGTLYHTAQRDQFLAVLGGSVYWMTTGRSIGVSQLWKTDGTHAGTVMVKEFGPDHPYNTARVAAIGGRLWIATDHNRLWISDGTAAGTVEVKQFAVDRTDNLRPIGPLLDRGGVAYFWAEDTSDGGGYGPWRSDGTAAGTVRVRRQDVPAAPFDVGGMSFGAWGGDGEVEDLEPYRLAAPDEPPPAAPEALSVTAVSGGEVQLAWRDVADDERSYRVERSRSATFDVVEELAVLLPGTTRHRDTRLAPDTTYYYRVYAHNAGGASPAASGSAATHDAPAAPAGLLAVPAAGSQSGRRVDLYWTDEGDGEAGYRLERSRTAQFDVLDFAVDLPPDQVDYADTAVERLTTYYYRVHAFSGANRSRYSEAEATTGDYTPAAPSPLSAAAVNDRQVELQWRDNSDNEREFRIERSVAGGPFQYLSSRPAGSTSYLDGQVAPGVSYVYRVVGSGPGGRGDYSNEVAVTGRPPLRYAPLLADLNTAPAPDPLGTSPSEVVVSNGVAYYAATDPHHGRELWRSDGTEAGTYLLADIDPTVGASPPFSLVAAGGMVFFLTDGGQRLWRTDGTRAGTVLLKSGLNVRPDSQAPAKLLAAADGGVYFLNNSTLWKSDGTEGGTVAVAAAPGNPATLLGAGSKVFFSAWVPSLGHELWVSDGTAAGTKMVKDIATGSSHADPGPLVALADGSILFAATTSAQGRELWRSDGTEAGTYIVRDIVAGGGGSMPRAAVRVGDAAFFTIAPWNSQLAGLWKTDGTAAGTVPVKTGAVATTLTAVADGVFFALPASRTTELWNSDGTEARTVRVGTIPTSPTPPTATAAGDGIFLVGGEAKTTLFHADETGTLALKTFPAPGPASVAAFGGHVLFSAADGTSGGELWKSDGTPEGTAMVTDAVRPTLGSAPEGLVDIGGVLYFRALDASGAMALYRSDGSGALPTRLGPGGIGPTAFGGRVYFGSAGAGGVMELWSTDGTPEGTAIVRELGAATVAPGLRLLAVGQFLFVDATLDDATGVRHSLWRTDGTAEGTIPLGPEGMTWAGGDWAGFGGRLYFSGATQAHGVELWQSDGTPEGTVLAEDVVPGPAPSNPTQFTSFNGRLYFISRVPGSMRLYSTDGTPDGTGPAQELSADVTAMAVAGGRMFIAGHDPATGQELWVSDGTRAGTRALGDLAPGPEASRPDRLTVVGDRVFMRGWDAASGGYWLSVSDGTVEGTRRVRAMGSGSPRLDYYFVAAGGRLFYTDSRDTLWQSDGTFGGTVEVVPLHPAVSHHFSQAPAAALGDRFVFAASDALFGAELRILDPTRPPAAPSGVAATPAGTTSVVVTWIDESKDETGFWVEREPTTAGGGEAGSYFLPAATTRFTDTGLTPGARYRYHIRSYSAGGASHPVQTREVTTETPPEVTHISVSSSGWSPAFLRILREAGAGIDGYAIGNAQSKPLPWDRIDRITVRFNEDVQVRSGDLRLTGSRVTNYTVRHFTYDSNTFTAVWTLARPILADKLLVSLAPAGVRDAAGLSAVPFSRRFDVLGGDVNRDGSVSAADYIQVRARQVARSSIGTRRYSIAHDVNGDGRMSVFDLAIVRRRLMTRLPATEPTA